MVARAQAAQREVPGAEVVDAGLEPRDAAGDDVDLRLVERPRRRRGAEVMDLAAGVDLPLREPRREEEELRQGREVDGACVRRARPLARRASRAGSVGGGTSRGSGTAGASGYTLNEEGLVRPVERVLDRSGRSPTSASSPRGRRGRRRGWAGPDAGAAGPVTRGAADAASASRSAGGGAAARGRAGRLVERRGSRSTLPPTGRAAVLADVVVLVAGRQDQEQLLPDRDGAAAARTEETLRLELAEGGVAHGVPF